MDGKAYRKLPIQGRKRVLPQGTASTVPSVEIKGKFMVLAGHEVVPVRGASPVENGMQAGIVQFPLMVCVEEPAEHVHEGAVGIGEICGL